MGRRSPIPAFCRLLKRGSTTIRNSSYDAKPEMEVGNSHHEDDDASVLHVNMTNLNRRGGPSQQKWDSERSTASTASSITSLYPHMTQEEHDDDEAQCMDRPHEDEDAAIVPSTSSKHVHFGNAEARVYPQILGDHPYCSQGCPLELGWSYEREEIAPVAEEQGDGADLQLPPLRKEDHHPTSWCYKLSPEERMAIVAPKYSQCELRKACRKQARCREVRHKQQKVRLDEFFMGRTCGHKALNTL